MKKLIFTFLLAIGIVAGPLGQFADAAGRTFSGGGSSRSSSSGSKSSPSPARSAPSPSRPAPSRSAPPPSKPAPSRAAPSRSPSSPRTAPLVKRSTNDSAAAQAAKREESKVAMKSSSAYQPKPTYTTSTGQSRPINASDPRVSSIRSNYSYNTYTTRTNRMSTAFGPSYTSYRSTVVYSDPISPFFYGYMLSSAINSNQRAEWLYHHRDQLDQARYKEMLAKDALLEAKLKELEAKGVAKNPNYTPQGVDADLMYSDDYIKAVANVDAAEKDLRDAQARTRAVEGRYHGGSWTFFGFLWGCVKFVFYVTVFALIVWFFISLFRWIAERAN